MMIKNLLTCILLFAALFGNAQATETWQATLHRPDGEQIIFNFKLENISGKKVMVIVNATERIKVDNVCFTADSVFIQMPVFESAIRAAVNKNGWQGSWIKGGSGTDHVMSFSAIKSASRFVATNGNALFNITGRWGLSFEGDSSAAFPSVGEFIQTGNKITGTILTPTGDYRYLQGVVTGNRLRLSTFDGAHAFLFTATIDNDTSISQGIFYSGKTFKESWHGVKDAGATVNADAAAMAMRPGEEKLNFTFPSLDGSPVSINDERFKNKVVIVQIMGSWCPNCMDETIFLSDYYKKNKDRGVEVIALAYEYSNDFNRSVKSLRKFQERFNVQYPMLITGVAVSDSLRTEKTLPQVTPIKFFPSSIIIDKKGIVRKFDTGFVGPGTGKHYESYTRSFYAYIEKLLAEE